jgi:hypothetical protein
LAFANGSREAEWGRDVRPILAARCFTCHGPDASTREGNLRLDDPHSALAERRRGAAIVAGHADRSEVLRRLLSTDPDERMPPDGPPLTAAEIDLVRQWIDGGAEWTEAWSWRPIAAPDAPAVRDASWIADPLDRFVLARLEAAGASPPERADARTLLRRASFDLTGLPPDAASLARIDADSTPASFAREVDRLLASTAFGERWGRHWLDLVRYAETYGHEFDYPIPYAWRYRDAVIRAFNEDRPYDRFVLEHIAGDLLPPASADESAPDPTLTGFWWLTQGTHAPVDVAKDEAERIDNQIDVLSKTFLGVTVACARCHDHKFDAITQRDYYGLSAHLKRGRRAVVESEARDAPERIGSIRAELLTARQAVEHRLLGAARNVEEALPAGAAVPESDAARLLTDFDEPMPDGFTATGHAFARTAEELPRVIADATAIRRAPSGIATSRAAGDLFAGTLRSPSFLVDHRYYHQRLRGKGTVRIIVDGYHLDEHNALLFDGHRRSIDHANFSVETWDLERFRGHRAHVEWIDDGPGVLEVDWLAASDRPDAPPLDGASDGAVLGDEADRVAILELAARPVPEPERYLGMVEGSPWPEFVRTRGVTNLIGEPAPPGLIESIDREAFADVESSPDRLAIAQRIVDPNHPLTARVMANRVWHHLIGRGIVTSVDDFGALGAPPTDPELLDHLADRFRADWSVKRLIRSIVLSSTYAMSSRQRPELASIDPTNALPHRAELRRLDAESLRDAMLLIAGRLDQTLGGPGVPTHLTEFMDGRGRPGRSGPVDGDGRRSVYLEVRRNFPDPFLIAFDMPIPTTTVGRRNRSNVPGQALALLNAPFVHAMSQQWGERVAARTGSVGERIADMFEAAFGRPARDAERASAEAFLAAEVVARGREGDPGPEEWAALAHVLFNAKEFLFID